MREPSTPENEQGGARRGRRVAWVAVAIAVIVAFAVTLTVTLTDSGADSGTQTRESAQRPQNPFEEARTLGVSQVLADYSAALRDGDAATAATALDQSATEIVRDRTRRSAEGIGSLPISTFEYRLSSTRGPERLVPAELQARLDAQGSSDSWVAPVQLRYAYEGIDSAPVVLEVPMVMARYPDGWKIVADSGPEFGEAAPAGQVWQYEEPAARPVSTPPGDSLVLTNGTSPLTDALAKQLPAATESVTGFWGTRWAQGAGVIVAGSDEEFASITGSSQADADAAAAVTIFSSIDPAGPTALGQRVVFAPQAAELDPNTLAVVLRHELFHVAARTVTAVAAPVWVTEGVAEYVGRRGTYARLEQAAPALAAEIAANGPPADLPADANFAPSNPDAALAYQSAWSVAAFIAETYGDDKLKRFYVALAGADQPSDPALVVTAQNTAAQIVLDVSRDELVNRWRAWLGQQV
ncbi:hypothetical protein [Williamsia sp. 1135]|uniref:hypothetical protein n=1 Tax=Williamsia sp. 1135 TaxID=1889262 RepID=UPI001180601B|nr:hypothetical protein [Williamsia sp. 1135]